ncbi:hypothetical protein T492DRAFT_1073568 [Pavlovales sp. CCMP2436]|nr:hypothetical protein T492DRAFT_1073568 [Pavlovales sp. CCMP2436]
MMGSTIGLQFLPIGAAAIAAVGLAMFVETRRLRARHQAHATDGRVFLHVTFEVKPSNEAAFFAAFRPLLAASTQEPGCNKYQMTKQMDGSAPHTYVLFEEWASAQALSAHELLPHFTTYVPQLATAAKITVSKTVTVDVAAKPVAL